MKGRIIPLLVLALTSTSAQNQTLRVSMSSTSVHECRHPQSKRYDIDVAGQLEVENRSDAAILLPKRVDVVRSVAVAVSPTDAKLQKYAFVMYQEFGATERNAKPRMDEFIAIRPQEKRTIEIVSTVIPATADPSDNDRDQLRSGKYWLQLEFLPLPNSFPSGDTEFSYWQEQWKSSGTLLGHYVLTEPFLVEVALDPKAAKCRL